MIKECDVVEKLNSLGYNINNGDELALHFAIESTERYIQNFCNIKEIPTELYSIAVEICAGKLVKGKLDSGVKVNDLIDFEVCNISSITEGDVSVSYNADSNNAVNRYIEMLDKMCNKDNELRRFKRLRW